MRKKVLFIDYILEKGHVNFNHIHIDALKRNGFDVYLILHQDIADLLPYDTNQYVAIIPPFLRKREGHPLLNRIIFLLSPKQFQSGFLPGLFSGPSSASWVFISVLQLFR